MFDDLMKALQSSGQEAVVNNPHVPNEHNQAVLQSAGSSIMDTLKGMIANGRGAEVAQLASNPNHPATKQMQSGFADSIMEKFGINGDSAKSIAGSLIPGVLAKLGGESNSTGPAGSFDISSITSMLGKGGLDRDKDGDVDLNDIGKMLGGTALDKDKDGDVDLNDVKKMLGF